MGRFADKPGKEMFVRHPDGSVSDRELHEEILAEGDDERAQASTRQWLARQGWSPNEINAWLEKPASPPHPAPAAAEPAIYLVSCVGKKRLTPCAARDLYTSEWFVKARAYVEVTGCRWFILSSKYGLVAPTETVEPYELTLNEMSRSARQQWAQHVVAQMDATLPAANKIIVFAGLRYREFLMDYLQRRAPRVEIPMQGLSIGKQLQFLKRGLTYARV
jgi:hypothetical protein